jgi:hypothetical protein
VSFLGWLLVAVLVALLWLYFLSRNLCPSCGLRMTETDLEHLEDLVFGRPDHCCHCGWKRSRS